MSDDERQEWVAGDCVMNRPPDRVTLSHAESLQRCNIPFPELCPASSKPLQTRTGGDRNEKEDLCRRKASFARDQVIDQAALCGRYWLWKELCQTRWEIGHMGHPNRPGISPNRVCPPVAAADFHGSVPVAFIQNRARLPVKIPDGECFHTDKFSEFVPGVKSASPSLLRVANWNRMVKNS